jgi:hypothetical protein
MGRGAGLHADEAGREFRKEIDHLATPQLLSDDHSPGRVDAVNLKHPLGEIQTDRANLHVDGPLM